MTLMIILEVMINLINLTRLMIESKINQIIHREVKINQEITNPDPNLTIIIIKIMKKSKLITIKIIIIAIKKIIIKTLVVIINIQSLNTIIPDLMIIITINSQIIKIIQNIRQRTKMVQNFNTEKTIKMILIINLKHIKIIQNTRLRAKMLQIIHNIKMILRNQISTKIIEVFHRRTKIRQS